MVVKLIKKDDGAVSLKNDVERIDTNHFSNPQLVFRNGNVLTLQKQMFDIRVVKEDDKIAEN